MSLWERSCLPAEVRTFAFLLAMVGIGAGVLALLAGRLSRRRSVTLRYGILFASVLGLLAAPVLVGCGQALEGLFALPTVEMVKIPAERLEEVLQAAADHETEVTDVPGLGAFLGTLLIGVWALGVALGLAKLGRGLCIQRRALVGDLWQPEWWNDGRRQDLADKVGLRSFPAVRQSPFAPLPMVVGLWRPCIVLPCAAPESWGQAKWEAVLLHEAAHIARRDPWAALAQSLAVALFWWCPCVHRLSRRVHELREAICDDWALESSCGHIAYAELLLEAAERLFALRTMPVVIGLLDSDHGGLEERISRLLAKEKRSRTRLPPAGKLFGVATLLVSCLAITAVSACCQAPQPHRKMQISITIDGKEFDLNDPELLERFAAARKKDTATGKRADWSRRLRNEKAPTDGGTSWQDIPVVEQPDPCIEKLVEQAEKLKPGAGDAVRKALRAEAPGEALQRAFCCTTRQDDADMEALIKRAETLTPGSGATIRQVLDAGKWWGLDAGCPDQSPTRDAEALSREVEKLNVELQELRRRVEQSNIVPVKAR